jgi:N-acetylglucosamine-6-phosphate deacetylase
MLTLIGRHHQSGELRRIVVDGERIAAMETPAGADPDALGGADHWLAPGLLDLQVNGFAGHDFNAPDVTPADVVAVAESLVAAGVTAFCPTVITASHAALVTSLGAIATACATSPLAGERILGIHLEGPYLSPEDGPRGAHPRAHVRLPDWDEFTRLQAASGGRIRMITLAPELPGALEFIARARQAGVIVALGHHQANRAQLLAAVEAGASLSTHLGNGCHALLPRHDNYLWEQLAHDGLSASIIVDGHHLPPAVVRTIFRTKGAARLILVSDAVAAAGLPPGRHRAFGAEVEVRADGSVHLAGTPYLAGSGLRLWEAVPNVMRMAGATFAEAIQMATANPAALLGCAGERGSLRVGARADITLFRMTPDGPTLAATVVGGQRYAHR